MNENRPAYKDEILTKIANHLIINASFMSDLGIYHGKMGIVIFFVHYSRYIGNCIYDDFAGELLAEIYEEIHTDTPNNFEFGLCGIGWGIEYLFDNHFVEGEPNDVLEDLDKKIMEKDVLRIADKSFKTGLAGISSYVESRLKSKNKNKKIRVFDKLYINHLKKNYLQVVKSKPKDILSEILFESPDNEDIHEMPLGLYKGCSGMGLKMILQ